MLMNHKNFHLKQIPDKTNDVIFLKSPKTLFWTKTKNLAVTYNYIWAPNSKVSEKTNGPIPRKLTDRWKDEWKDTPYFIGLFQLRLSVQ